MIEYATLIAAISLGVFAASRLVYDAFTAHAQVIEDTQMVF